MSRSSGIIYPVTRRGLLRLAGGAVLVASSGGLLAACGSGAAKTTGNSKSSSTPAAPTLKVSGGTAASMVKVSAGTVTMNAQGADMWGSTDAGTFFYTKTTAATGTWIVKVASMSKPSGDGGWAKAGILARNTTDPASADVFAMVSDSNGFGVQHRDGDGANEGSNGAADWQQTDKPTASGGTGSVPTWIKLTLKGGVWTAFDSQDGKTWANPATAPSTSLPQIASTYLIGLAATSHDPNNPVTVVFSNWSGASLGTADTI